MSVFENVERGVVSTSFNKKTLKKFDMVSESTISNQALRRIDRQDKIDKINRDIELHKKEDMINSRMESLSKHAIMESQIDTRISTIGNDLKLSIFKDIIYEVFNNALVLDADFVHENHYNLKKVTDDFIDNNGGFSLLENAINETGSVLLKRIKTVCESLSNDMVKRIIKESKTCKEDVNTKDDIFRQTMTDEEENKLDYSKDSLDIEKISELVKDKVLTVVRDEKENEIKHDELVTDIENELTDNEEVVDNKTIDEAFSKIILNNNILNEATLFGAILQDTYESILAENVAISTTNINSMKKDDERSASYDVNADTTNYEDVSDDDDETSIEELDGIDNDLVLEKTATVDMDMVMAESLVKYTMMETMYTLKLKDYSYDDIKKMTEKVANRHITKSGPLTESKITTNENVEESKVYESFFKNLRNLKNISNVDKSKDNIAKIMYESTEDLRKNLCKIAIEQLEAEKVKNSQFTENYNEYITFLKSME